MFDELGKILAKELELMVRRSVGPLRRRAAMYIVRMILLLISVTCILAGAILLGGKYIGIDLMLLVVGGILFLLFLIIR